MVHISTVEGFENEAFYSYDDLMSITTSIVNEAIPRLRDYFKTQGGAPEALFITGCDIDRIYLSENPDADSDSPSDYDIRTWEVRPSEDEDEQGIYVEWTFFCMGPDHAIQECSGETLVSVMSFDDYSELSDEEFLMKMMTAVDKDDIPHEDRYNCVDTDILGKPALERLQSIADKGSPQAAWVACMAFNAEEFEDYEQCKKYLQQAALSGESPDWFRAWVNWRASALYEHRTCFPDNWASYNKEIIAFLSLIRDCAMEAGKLFTGENREKIYSSFGKIFFGSDPWIEHTAILNNEWELRELRRYIEELFMLFGNDGSEELADFLKAYPTDVMDALGDSCPKFLRRMSEGGEFVLFGYSKDKFLDEIEDLPISAWYADVLRDTLGLDFAISFLKRLNEVSGSELDNLDFEVFKRYADETCDAELADSMPIVALCSDIIDGDSDEYLDTYCKYTALAISRGMNWEQTSLFNENIVHFYDSCTIFDDFSFDDVFTYMRKYGIDIYLPEAITLFVKENRGLVHTVTTEEKLKAIDDTLDYRGYVLSRPAYENIDPRRIPCLQYPMLLYYADECKFDDLAESDDEIEAFTTEGVKPDIEIFESMEKWIDEKQDPVLPDDYLKARIEILINNLEDSKSEWQSRHEGEEAVRFYAETTNYFTSIRTYLDRMHKVVEERC